MNLLITPRNTLLGRALRSALAVIPKSTIVTSRSGLTKGMKWVVGSSTHGCWLGNYELEHQAIVREYVRPGMNVLDLGANAGYFTLAFAALGARTWAFEPLATNVVNLIRHITLNRLDTVTVIQAAVADRTGMSGFCAFNNNAVGKLADDSEYRVPTVSLDELIAAQTIPTPDFIKMDIEGAEVLALKGSRALLAKRRTHWLISLHGNAPNTTEAAVHGILRDAGYRWRQTGERWEEILASPQ
jgi:FkbM family methyltransferase